MEKLLYPLFRDVFGCEPEETVAMTGSGSHRQYFRLSAGGRSAVGVVGTDADENRAFLSLDNHFASKGIQVPKVLAQVGDVDLDFAIALALWLCRAVLCRTLRFILMGFI